MRVHRTGEQRSRLPRCSQEKLRSDACHPPQQIRGGLVHATRGRFCLRRLGPAAGARRVPHSRNAPYVMTPSFCASAGSEQFAVLDAEEVFVGEEDFEGAGAVADDFAQLRFGFIAELRDRHVEGIIAGAVSIGLLLPEGIALCASSKREGQHISMYVVVPPIRAAMLAVSCVSLAKVDIKGR